MLPNKKTSIQTHPPEARFLYRNDDARDSRHARDSRSRRSDPALSIKTRPVPVIFRPHVPPVPAADELINAPLEP